MPLYDFACTTCGGCFEARAGYEMRQLCCPACGGVARRAEVYRQATIIAGATLPPREDAMAVQQEWFREVRKAGWDGDRAISEIRKNLVEDREGRLQLDVRGMTQST